MPHKVCIPSKLLIYPADLVRLVETMGEFGIDVELKGIDFKRVIERMKGKISKDIGQNPRFLPNEEPEVSELAKREMSKHMNILTNHGQDARFKKARR